MYERLFQRFPNHHERDCLQHLRQANVPVAVALKLVDAGLRPATILRLLLRVGMRALPHFEELLDEIDAAQRGRPS
jgi:hypothetical protein